MARNRRSFRRPSRPRRRYEWARTFVGETYGGSDTARTIDLLANFQQVLGADAAGTTITCIRGELVFTYNYNEGGSVPGDNAFWTGGIRVDENQVTGLSDAQQGEKAAQRYADWMWYRRFPIFPANLVLGDPSNPLIAYRAPIDIKSQRRFDELQQSLFLFSTVTNMSTTDETALVTMSGDLHVLCKMP